MPGITHWQHQKWFGYFPSVVTFESILGDLYSSSVTNPGFNVSVLTSSLFNSLGPDCSLDGTEQLGEPSQ